MSDVGAVDGVEAYVQVSATAWLWGNRLPALRNELARLASRAATGRASAAEICWLMAAWQALNGFPLVYDLPEVAVMVQSPALGVPGVR
jgi:hypothetical protein